MKPRKINKKTFSWQGFSYRFFVICVNTLFFKFGAKEAMNNFGAFGASLIWNAINMALYFLYHGLFLKLFSLEVQTKGCVVWFTGLPCSGKSSIADGVADILLKKGKCVERLDGDCIRQSLCVDLGFSKKDRDENIKRVTFVSKLLSRNKTIVLASFVSPFRATRFKISESVTNFIEVYVFADKVTCASRDVKGMWAKAKEGKIKGFTGFDSPYEPPYSASVTCITEKETIEESVQRVIGYLKKRKLI